MPDIRTEASGQQKRCPFLRRSILQLLGLLLIGFHGTGTLAEDSIAAGFENPPNSARPRVWWHWMNGNITQDGIQKDMEWMHRIGIGGLQNFDAALSTPQIVPQRFAYMTPGWTDAFHFAAKLAEQLGLELAIAGSPGWSESGGPWVPPQDAMKKLVWSETLIQGGRHFSGLLAHPPSVTGPYQTVALHPGVESMMSDVSSAPPPMYYGDIAVLAYRVDEETSLPNAEVRTSDGQNIDPRQINDPNGPGIPIPADRPGAPASVVMTFPTPQTIRSASVFLPAGASMFFASPISPRLEAQNDAGEWRKIADIPAQTVPDTVSFAPVTARSFRLLLQRSTNTSPLWIGGAPGTVPFKLPIETSDKLALFQLSAQPRVNRFEAKAGFTTVDDYYALDANTGPHVKGVSPDSVIDVTAKMSADGRLDWTAPSGHWKVLRLGYSLEGITNHPATAEATGLEVDEYDGAAVRRYIETYLGNFQKVTGLELMGKHGLRAQVNDSTEVGPSNWTPNLLAQFKRLRGYDPRPWLPALTGTIVGSRAQSDAFLYDFRRTLADLVVSEHYQTIASVVHQHGMIEYGEALESGRPSLGDDMAMRRYTDIPMSALWSYEPAIGPQVGYLADMKGAASVAHIYGQNLVAAESMTSAGQPWAFAPSDLKRYIDLEFLMGVNRPIVHTSVHQPTDDKLPGLSLMIFGQYFNRHETWAEMARPWVDYMTRSSYLLQQGHNVADVAYFYGEEAPLVDLYKSGAPLDAPSHYAYDYVNSDVVLHELSVEGHDLVSGGGARYRMLYLGGTSYTMTVAMLQKLAQLAEAGATIVGMPPASSPGLQDDPAKFSTLVKRLWGGGATTRIGAGQVVATRDVETVLHDAGLGPDFHIPAAASDSQILFVHRHVTDGEIYFVDNRKQRAEHVDVHFRVVGKAPDIWSAESGSAVPASYRTEGDETVVPLDLGSEEAEFIVFRSPTTEASRNVAKPKWIPAGDIPGAWDLSFQPDRGAPTAIRFEHLQSLTDSSNSGIKYFSGTVTYRTSFRLPKGATVGGPLMLDLGRVGDIAQVLVNGKELETLWKAPFQVDIGAATHAGMNQLEVRVADLWVNRLIGDAQPGAKKITWTSLPTYLPTAPLRPSGLLGPVSLLVPAPTRN